MNDEVFFGSGLPLARVAAQLAEVLQMGYHADDSGHWYLGAEEFAGIPGITNSQLTGNIYSAGDLYPDEDNIYDGCDAVLNVYRPDRNLELQAKAARAVLDRVVQTLGWRAVLLHNLDRLVATWDPQHGLRDYPPGTSPYAEDKALWAIP